MCNNFEEDKLRDKKEFNNKRGLRHQGVSWSNRRVISPGLPSNRNKRDLLHHLVYAQM